MKNIFKDKKHYLFLLAILIGGLLLACCWPIIEGLDAPPPPKKDANAAQLAALAAQVTNMLKQ